MVGERKREFSNFIFTPLLIRPGFWTNATTKKKKGNGETHRVKEIFNEEKGSLLSIFRTTKGYFLRLPIGKRITDGSII